MIVPAAGRLLCRMTTPSFSIVAASFGGQALHQSIGELTTYYRNAP